MALTPGIYTPVPVFFKKDLKTIDFETQIEHARFLRDNGITGIVLLGSTGENVHLTREERLKLVYEVSANVKNFTILVGVAQQSLEDVKTELKLLADSGASTGLVLPSNYYGGFITQEGLIEWYQEIADSSPIPILLYIYPGVSNGVSISAASVKRLSAHSNIVGVKFSHADLAAYSEVALDPEVSKNNFICMTGLGQILLPAFSVGINGAVDAISGAFPKIYIKLMKALEENDFERARPLQLAIVEGEKIVGKFGILGIKRTIKETTGFGETYLGRCPLNKDTCSKEWDSFSKCFQAMSEIENAL